MASRADRKRESRKAAEVRRWFEECAFDDDRPRARGFSIKIDFGPLAEASRKVAEAFRALVAKMRGLATEAKKAARVRRERPAYPTTTPQRSRCPARRHSSAFRLPRGGGRWSER